MARLASLRTNAFDVIDTNCLLCCDGGICGLCTWFEPLLKKKSHAYMQTRHCEEMFIKNGRPVSDRIGDEIDAKIDDGFEFLTRRPLPRSATKLAKPGAVNALPGIARAHRKP